MHLFSHVCESIETVHLRSKKLNLDGKTVQEFAERVGTSRTRSAEEGRDELCSELVAKYQVAPKLLMRFVAALEQL